MKRDYFSNETLIPLIGYEVYHPINYSKLDLSYCNNSVSLNIPAKINEDKIYQYDPTSDYYNDKCSSYTSDNGTDILLFDRKKEYTENNLALCEANCIYKGYDQNYKQSICDCNIEKNIEYISNISNNPNVLSQDFNISENDYGYANVFGCTKNLFSVNGILKNMSSDILIVSILFFAGTSLFFRKRGYNILVNQINNIINDKMNYQTKIHMNKKDSKKSNKHKKLSLKNNEAINFPPKKSNSKSASILSLNNNISNIKLKDKKKHSKRFKSKKLSHKITEKASNKENNDNCNVIMRNFLDCEMNSFDYSEALSYDNRTCFQYYCSLLKAKQPILFAFCPNDDYNSRLIKIGIFILSFNIHYATNFVYFLNEKIIHKIFEDNGKYDIKFFLPYIVVTFVISHFITIFIKLIFLTDSNIIEIKKQKDFMLAEEAVSTTRKKIILKYIIFYIIGISFHLFFWYFLSSFSNVYKNTQVFVLENALLAYIISLIYPFIFNIIPCILRICSLSGKAKNHYIIYNISKLFQFL